MSRAEPGLSDNWGRWSAWRAQHKVAMISSWQRVVARPGATWLTWLVLAISLALPSATLLTLDSVRQVTHALGGAPQVSVLLHIEAELSDALALQRRVDAWPEVAKAVLIDREQALAEFTENSGFKDLVDTLAYNPLPYTLLVKPVEGSDLTVVRQLSAQLEAEAAVARVIVDAQWIERLEQLLHLGSRWVEGLGGAMILGAILVVANTLRLSIDACREEIIVVRLLGGSDAFARRPFLYAGLWYGVGGGIVAAVLVWGFGLWLSGPLNALLLLYDRPAQPLWLDPQYLIALLFGAATMGWLASWWVTKRFLSRLDSA